MAGLLRNTDLTRALTIPLALAIALLAASPSPAGAQWLAEGMPGTAGALPPARSLAFDRSGRALALFEAFASERRSPRFTGIALRGTDGAWSAPTGVTGIGWGSAQVFAYARTRALLVTRQVTGYGRYHRARFRLVWAPGSTAGRFDAYRQIAPSADPPAVAVNPAGDALVAFTPQGKAGVRIAERRAGGGFGAPRTVSGVNGVGAAVALNARGDRVVAWVDRTGVHARIAPAGRSWGPAQRVSRDRLAGGLRALVAENGRVVVTWAYAEVSESHPARLQAGVAVHPRGGGWHARGLEHSELARQGLPAEAVAIPVVDSSGQLLVAYDAKQGAGVGVELADVSNSAQIGTVIAVSGASTAATLDDVAAGAAGRLALTWAEHDASGGGVRTFARLRPGAGGFDAAADLTLPGQVGLAGSRVAFSPLTGQAIVVRGYLAEGKPALAAAASAPTSR
jgi:hypothetical protein